MNLILSRPSMCALLMVRALTGGLFTGIEPDLGPTKEEVLAMADQWAKAEIAAMAAWDNWLPPENSPWLPDLQPFYKSRRAQGSVPVTHEGTFYVQAKIRRFLLYGSMATRGTAAYRVRFPLLCLKGGGAGDGSPTPVF